MPAEPAATAPTSSPDELAIAAVVRTFFAAFTSGPGCLAGLEALREVLLPQAVVVRAGGEAPAVYDVEGFIAPRQALLAGGTLTGFSEWEVEGRTEVLGDVAQHASTYAKAWEQDGVRRTGRGRKTLQLVRMPDGWRISAVAWVDDEVTGG